MLLWRCLIYVTVIILRHISYLVYLCPRLGLGLLVSYLRGLFFIFSFIFIVTNHTASFKQTYLFFEHFLWMKKANDIQIAKVQPKGVA